MERTYSVYWMRCPETKLIRYIGISMNPKHRLKWHLKSGYPHTASQKWVVALRDRGLIPIQQIVFSGLTKEQAESVEARLVFLHSNVYRGRLVQKHLTVNTAKRSIRLGCSSMVAS